MPKTELEIRKAATEKIVADKLKETLRGAVRIEPEVDFTSMGPRLSGEIA